MKTGIAGGVESSDCLITVSEANGLTIEVNSIVDLYYHDSIVATIKEVLKEKNISNLKVTVEDKGALDFTIKARLLTALERMK